MDSTYHYPPELLQLFVQAIPLICPAKKDVFAFFRGAGVGAQFTRDLSERFAKDPKSVGKHEIVRTVLTRLNDRGEAALRERVSPLSGSGFGGSIVPVKCTSTLASTLDGRATIGT